MLIRFVLDQYGHVADVPLNGMMRGQSSGILGRDNYSESGEPNFRTVSPIQMEAYFGWRVPTVGCFSNINAEVNYRRDLFQIPLRSRVRDYQHAQVHISWMGMGRDTCMNRLEMMSHFWRSRVYQ